MTACKLKVHGVIVQNRDVTALTLSIAALVGLANLTSTLASSEHTCSSFAGQTDIGTQTDALSKDKQHSELIAFACQKSSMLKQECSFAAGLPVYKL